MFPRTFRATSTVVVFWVSVAFAALLVGDAVFRGAWSTVLAYLPPVLLVLWVLWLVLWRTSVRALPDRVIVTNLVRIHDVPWDRVAEVRQRGQVTLELDDSRQLLCWGGPFPAKPGIPRSSRRRPADSFAATLDHYRRSAPPSTEPVRRRWDVVAIVLGIVLVLAMIARLLFVNL
jgi:energy-coupling factor transporter transmembrane protein EcfT